MLGRSEISATLVCPNRSLAEDLKRAAGQQSVEFLEEMADYPTSAQLEARLRQLRPSVLFVDLGTNLETALSLVTMATAMNPAVYVVGLAHHHQTTSSLTYPSRRCTGRDTIYESWMFCL